MSNVLICRTYRAVAAGLFLLLASAAGLRAADSEWFTRSWQSDDELPNNTVTGLAQTPDGYLWLGTPSGLVRFDGLRFEEFSPTNFIAPPNPNRGTIAMIRGRNGALWLALDRGAVVKLQGNASRNFGASLPDIIPNGLAEDSAGDVWVAYRNGAVYHIKEEQVTACTLEQGLPPGSEICALASDKEGRVWFAKAGQVGVIANGAFQTLLHLDAVQPTRLATARAGGVWLCSGFRLYRISPHGQITSFGEFHPEREGTIATALLEDREGAVWIGTSFSGLFRHDQEGFQVVPTSHQEIISLAEDREGNLWVGTAGGGLNRLRRRAITLEDTESGLPFSAIQSICQDAAGTLWAVTQNGVVVRNSGSNWMALTAGENAPTNATCVAADAQGAVWIGSRPSGLYCWRDGQFVSWGDPKELHGLPIHTLLASRNGDLWIGEESPPAIQRLRAGQLRTFPVPSDSRVIRAMAEDAAGNIWAATSKGVLLRVSGDHLVEVKLRSSQELASIRCLYATPDGALLLGYAGWGVGYLKDGHYAEIHSEQGLYDDYISHMVDDGRGWLWFAANRGIYKVQIQALEDVAAGRSARLRSIHYGRSEGLPSLQGTFGSSPDVLRSRDGRLWLSTRTALVVVAPDKVDQTPGPSPVFLTRVAVDDHAMGWYSSVLPLPKLAQGIPLDLTRAAPLLQLSPGHRRLQFDFAAPFFTAPENLQFRYRLEGFDEGWVDAGTRRSVDYSRLPAGKYLFEAKVSDSQGVWRHSSARLTVVVSPFFWQTWWFRLLVLTSFTAGVIALVRYLSFRRLHRRLRALEQQAALHKERARIAKDIHDDLGADLTQIAFLGELAQQDRTDAEKVSERMSRISRTARQAIKSLDEIVWAVNPRNDTLAHLIDYTGQFALDYLRLAGIRCRVDLPDQPPTRELSTDLRHNLFLVIKEALHNIVKHARATEVWVRVHVTDEALEMVIEDNGCGFAQAPDNALADGLRNMRQRLSDIGGEFRMASQPGAGTKVSLRLPWRKPSA